LNINKDIKIISENGAEKTIIDGGKIKQVIIPLSGMRPMIMETL
tara:strand:- start:225 stop:356 length:132 start_codon:yes stop_codon:yes gene_type:complete